MSLLWMVAITLVILQISVFCTTIYLHRAKTHKGLELNPVVGLLMHLFMYRKEARDPQTIRKYTPDWKPDVLDRIPGLEYGALGGMAIFMLMFGVWWGLAAWWVHVIGYILLNSSINSVCHMVGYRNFDNKATNLKSIAMLTAGEGLHNNHHEFPTSARFAWRGHEIDPAWPVCLSIAPSGCDRRSVSRAGRKRKARCQRSR